MRDLIVSLFFPFLFGVLGFNFSSTPYNINRINSLEDKKWNMQEIRFLQDNKPYYYNREERSENNMNFDHDYITFKQDGSGIYHQTDNTIYKLTWGYVVNKKNAIWFEIPGFRNNADLKVNWENIDLANNVIKYTEYYTHSTGIQSLGYGIRTSNDKTCENNQLHLISSLQ